MMYLKNCVSIVLTTVLFFSMFSCQNMQSDFEISPEYPDAASIQGPVFLNPCKVKNPTARINSSMDLKFLAGGNYGGSFNAPMGINGLGSLTQINFAPNMNPYSLTNNPNNPAIATDPNDVYTFCTSTSSAGDIYVVNKLGTLRRYTFGASSGQILNPVNLTTAVASVYNASDKWVFEMNGKIYVIGTGFGLNNPLTVRAYSIGSTTYSGYMNPVTISDVATKNLLMNTANDVRFVMKSPNGGGKIIVIKTNGSVVEIKPVMSANGLTVTSYIILSNISGVINMNNVVAAAIESPNMAIYTGNACNELWMYPMSGATIGVGSKVNTIFSW